MVGSLIKKCEVGKAVMGKEKIAVTPSIGNEKSIFIANIIIKFTSEEY